MTEEALKQTSSLIKNAKNIAVLLPVEVSMDSLMAASALKGALQQDTVSVSIFSRAKALPAVPFLKPVPEVRPQFSKSDQFAVKISTAHAKPGELRYEVESDAVVIYLKSSSGEFMSEDVSVLPVRQKFDLFISLGVSQLEQLGSLYTDNAAIFFDTPHINIDNKPNNEYFGTVNEVVVTASSISELMINVLSDLGISLQDDLIATSLLAGIIDSTHSFRDTRTTPKTLAAAAKLIDAGGRQQDIVQYLFKTKSFATLQLWGRALARLTAFPSESLISTVLTKSDIAKTETNESVFPEVLRDMAEVISGYSVIVLIAEQDSKHIVLLAGLPHVKVDAILSELGAAPQIPQPLSGQFEFVSSVIENKTTTQLQEEIQRAVKK